MKEIQFSKEQKMLHQAILHANNTPAYGLFDGEMGIVLVLSEYERRRKERPVRTAVNFLLDNVLTNLHKNMPLDFANGLTGIGWGVEYLIQKGFQKGVGVEICAAIDAKLLEVNLKRVHDFSLETGIKGWLHYIVAHVQGATRQGRVAFDREFLTDCHDVCRRLSVANSADKDFASLSEALEMTLQGNESAYTFDLKEFIQNSKAEEKALGLHNGISGQLYKTITEDKV